MRAPKSNSLCSATVTLSTGQIPGQKLPFFFFAPHFEAESCNRNHFSTVCVCFVTIWQIESEMSSEQMSLRVLGRDRLDGCPSPIVNLHEMHVGSWITPGAEFHGDSVGQSAFTCLICRLLEWSGLPPGRKMNSRKLAKNRSIHTSKSVFFSIELDLPMWRRVSRVLIALARN